MKTNTTLKTAISAILLTMSGASFANTVTAVTPFSGLIGATCTLTQTSAGVMAVNPANATQMGSVPAYGGGAAMGTITVACNNTGAVTVANPVPTGAAASAMWGTASTYGASVQLAGVNKAAIVKGGASTTSNITSGVYDVSATLSNNASSGLPLPAGDYAVTVTTTLVAN